MGGMRDLPERVFKFLEVGVVSEFVTMNAAGVPIDTPTYYFPSDDMATVDVATSIANPTKADRARRNPKVGLLMEGAPDEPVVCMRGHAAVRDSNLQRNCERYIAETGFKSISMGLPWAEARKAVQYWTRLIIEITPLRIMWWNDHAEMEGSPSVWNAPADVTLPASDAAPTGSPTKSASPARLWQEVAREAAARAVAGHLSLCDDEGYPLSFRTRGCELVDKGFRLLMPRGLPWRGSGKASLTFSGFQTFVGEAMLEGGTTFFSVERALPQSAGGKNQKHVLQPPADIAREKMQRVETEAKRRGQPVPVVPLEEPALTRLGQLRHARLASKAPITGITVERGNRST